MIGYANAAEAFRAMDAVNNSTDATGYYSFNVPPGNYTLIAELPGYSFTSTAATVLTGDVSAQAIAGYMTGTAPPPTTLSAPVQPSAGNQPAASQFPTGYPGGVAGWVEGKIMDQGGAPIPMAGIKVDGFAAGSSDEQGNYRIAPNPGLHRIDADKAGFGIPPRVVPVFAGHTAVLNLVGKRTVALGARVN